jgi:hypothetical protein
LDFGSGILDRKEKPHIGGFGFSTLLILDWESSGFWILDFGLGILHIADFGLRILDREERQKKEVGSQKTESRS